MKIVEIRKLKNKYQITLDNGEKHLVLEDTIVKYRLLPGQEFNQDIDLEKENFKEKMYQKALRFASYGKSENQMIEYLNAQGMENTYDLIMRLKKERWIDDKKMILALARKDFSYLMLESKLRFYKFEEKDIEWILSSYDELIPLKKQLSIAYKKYEKEAYPKKQEKIYRYLVSKGFNESSIQSLMHLS